MDKQKKPVLMWVLAVAAVLLLVLSVFAYTTRYSKEETEAMIKASEDALNADHKIEIDAVNAKVDDLAAKQAAAEAEKAKLEADKKALEEQVAKYEADLAAEEVKVEAESCKHVLDELSIGEAFSEALDDSELECKLADGSVEFASEDFDFEEKLIVGGKSVANLADNGPKDFLEVSEGDIRYEFWMQINFDRENVDDETDGDRDILSISLLGSPVKITEWGDDYIVLLEGKRYVVKEGDALTVGDKVVNIALISEEAVYVTVGEDSEVIEQGDSHKVGGIDIRVDSAMESETRSAAILTIGEDVEQRIEDGDEFAEDSPWVWEILGGNKISLVLDEDFTEVDEDEDFMALSAGDKLCLPGDYICMRYDGLTEETMLDYKFTADSGWIRVDGSFKKVGGILEVDRIYIAPNGRIYSEDEPCPGGPTEDDDCIDFGFAVELHGTDNLVLHANPSYINIGDLFRINQAFSVIEVDDWTSLTDEEDYLTEYGMLIKNPENALEDEKLSIEIPSERIEYSVSILG